MSGVIDINGKDDELYQDAVDAVRGYDKATIVFLQRELKVGYNRAARLMIALEEAKVVTPFSADGTRQVIYDDLPKTGKNKKKADIVSKAVAKPKKAKKQVQAKQSDAVVNVPVKKKPIAKKAAQKKPAKKQAKKPTQKPIKTQKSPGKKTTQVKAAPKKKQTPETPPKKKIRARDRHRGPVPKHHINHQEWDKLAVMTLICQDLIKTSYGLNYICRHNDEYPSQASVFNWFNAEDLGGGEKPLLDMYARAKRLQADYVVDEMHEIADDGQNDYMEKEGKDGETYMALNPEAINRSRLRIDTRKWTSSKLNNRKYGDKLELANNEDRPLSTLTDEELAAQIAVLVKQIGITPSE